MLVYGIAMIDLGRKKEEKGKDEGVVVVVVVVVVERSLTKGRYLTIRPVLAMADTIFGNLCIRTRWSHRFITH